MKVIHMLFITDRVNKFTPNNYTKICEKCCLKVVIKKGLTFLAFSESCISLSLLESTKSEVYFFFNYFSTVFHRYKQENCG